MSNSLNSIKNFIRKYFVTSKSDIPQDKELPPPIPPQRTYVQTKVVSRRKEIRTPEILRAMKSLEIANPFKGV